ncbi:MAG TPA: transglutaminase family protein [Abditibacterium sp.]|jgi:transglutaminase-like putative cysteine protease
MISRTQFEICVRYSEAVFDSRRTLRILPLRREGQIVRREDIRILPPAISQPVIDPFGNRVLVLSHARIERKFRLTMGLEVETTGEPVPDALLPSALLPDAQPHLVMWKMPSRAVRFVPELQSVARFAREMPTLERAAHFSRFCFLQLEYEAKTDACPPSSSEVWQRGYGNCADFAHVFLSLCRCSGMMARYVAGFNLSQGQMHAWAEVWSDGAWHAFDPTVGRAASLGSVAVAVGRDFHDCAPHQGSFRGAATAHLMLFCRTQTQERDKR